MTRYFYNDPLAAAYMAREFGVQLQYWYSGIKAIYPDRIEIFGEEFREIPQNWHTSLADILGGGMHLNHARYYIHPDSLPIFEPRMGDLCEFTRYDDDGELIENEFAEYGNVFPIGIPDLIIQRDNKPFFWPESEQS